MYGVTKSLDSKYAKKNRGNDDLSFILQGVPSLKIAVNESCHIIFNYDLGFDKVLIFQPCSMSHNLFTYQGQFVFHLLANNSE